MWTRRELKRKAREALKRNYWKAVLASALSIVLSGGLSYSSSASATSGANSVVAVNEDAGQERSEAAGKQEAAGEAQEEDRGEGNPEANGHGGAPLAAFVGMVIFLVIFLVLLAVMYVFMELLYNPFYVGVQRFMLKSVDDRAEVREIVYGFDHSYQNIVRTMFQKDIRVFLWALLFIIPGIYKKYQYRMVSYLLAERPDLDYKEALRASREMMEGEKWHAFVLDLSFIPWHMLGMMTCGMAEFFYVGPYAELANAALYRKLCGSGTAEPETALEQRQACG